MAVGDGIGSSLARSFLFGGLDRAIRDRLAVDFHLEPAGEREIRGIGTIACWYLERQRAG